jgi:hypothetical protein
MVAKRQRKAWQAGETAMTFDDDSLFLETPAGRRIIRCKSIGLDWPPPERIHINEVAYDMVSLSSITDEQRESMTHVLRGALYEPNLQ